MTSFTDRMIKREANKISKESGSKNEKRTIEKSHNEQKKIRNNEN